MKSIIGMFLILVSASATAETNCEELVKFSVASIAVEASLVKKYSSVIDDAQTCSGVGRTQGHISSFWWLVGSEWSACYDPKHENSLQTLSDQSEDISGFCGFTPASRAGKYVPKGDRAALLEKLDEIIELTDTISP